MVASTCAQLPSAPCPHDHLSQLNLGFSKPRASLSLAHLCDMGNFFLSLTYMFIRWRLGQVERYSSKSRSLKASVVVNVRVHQNGIHIRPGQRLV